MDELVNLVAKKAGLSQDQAKAAVTTVITFIKGKLPGPIASQIDGVLSGSSASGVKGAIGGLFGKK